MNCEHADRVAAAAKHKWLASWFGNQSILLMLSVGFGNRLPSHLLTSTVIVCRSARANHDGPGRWAWTARLGHAVDWRVSWSIWNFEFNCSISNSLMEQDMESAGSPLLIGREFALRTPFPSGGVWMIELAQVSTLKFRKLEICCKSFTHSSSLFSARLVIARR